MRPPGSAARGGAPTGRDSGRSPRLADLARTERSTRRSGRRPELEAETRRVEAGDEARVVVRPLSSDRSTTSCEPSPTSLSVCATARVSSNAPIAAGNPASESPSRSSTSVPPETRAISRSARSVRPKALPLARRDARPRSSWHRRPPGAPRPAPPPALHWSAAPRRLRRCRGRSPKSAAPVRSRHSAAIARTSTSASTRSSP